MKGTLVMRGSKRVEKEYIMEGNMKGRFWFCYLLTIISIVIMNACATTQFDSVWKDSTYQGGVLRKVLIIGITKKQQVRRYFEEEFAGKLQVAGTDAVPSYTVLPEDRIPDKETVAALINTLKIDSVLITKFVDIKDVGTYQTMPTLVNEGYYGYYIQSSHTESLGYNVVLDTKIFEAKNEKLIWSALTETVLEGEAENSVDSFIPDIINKLRENKLIQ
jgi:hypothetical protein